MKKYIVIMATVTLLLLVFAPAALAAPPAWGGWDDCGDTCYTVQYGDTLFSIGRMYGVNPWDIARVNGLPNPDCIYAGQVLIIPADDCCDSEGGRWPHGGGGPGPIIFQGGGQGGPPIPLPKTEHYVAYDGYGYGYPGINYAGYGYGCGECGCGGCGYGCPSYGYNCRFGW